MSPDGAPRLLVVEDEEHLAAGLKMNFELEGYQVDVARSGREAAHALVRPEAYALILLDVMLPDIDGFELCRRLRLAGNRVPVIMLTARSDPQDRVRGLEAGADDYLGKPFDLKELLARVRSHLRRQQWMRAPAAEPGNVLRFGQAQVDFETYSATVRGEEVKLTRLEFDLVRYFAENAGRVVERGELLENVWKLRSHPNTRTVDNFVARLRKHFEDDPANPRHFVSVRGAGYKFVPSP
jgi:two-component system OmpR family response regulator